jgi:hypothetical protein
MMLTALPATAFAARLDGNALLARCSTGDVKGCSVYLDGFAAALTEIPEATRPACIPESVNGLQMRDVVIQLLRKDPGKRQLPAARLIMHAYAHAWPCHR